MARNIAHQEVRYVYSRRETTSSLLFVAGFRPAAAVSMAAPILCCVGVGYRGEVNGWLLGVNTFLVADIRYFTYVAAWRGFAKNKSWPFPAAIIFLSPAGKLSAVHELHDERPAYGF